MLLAIDTSTRNASVSIFNNGSILSEMSWQSAQNHSRELMPNIMTIVQQANIALSNLTGVVIAVGPGSFSALRVGMSVAKGLAFSLTIPLVGISTLEAIAYQQAAASYQICSLLGAGRGEVAAAVFKNKRGQLQCLLEEQILTIETLTNLIARKTIFCGEIDQNTAASLTEILGEKAVLLPAVTSYRRAGFVADLGWKRLESGQADDIETLQPVYLRRPSVGGQRT